MLSETTKWQEKAINSARCVDEIMNHLHIFVRNEEKMSLDAQRLVTEMVQATEEWQKRDTGINEKYAIGTELNTNETGE